MSAHGIPGAFSSAIKTVLKWVLISLVAVIILKFVSNFFPTFSQGNIKDIVSKKESIKNNQEDDYSFDLFNSKTWTYEAMLERDKQSRFKNENKTNYYTPVLIPRINEYYNYKENTTQNEWYVDGSIWNN